MGRRNTDPRFTVETPRSRAPAFLVLALVIAAVAWSIRESVVDDLSPPYSPPDEPVTATDPGGHADAAATSAPARGDLSGLISSHDYPVDALDRGEQGTVETELVISERGKVLACKVLSSSGSPSLDSRTCDILASRARFAAARGPDGRRVASTFTQKITWRIAE